MKWGIIVLVLWIAVLLSLLFAPINEKIVHPFLGFKHWDKVAHFGLFFITGFIAFIGARFLRRFWARMCFGITFCLFLAVGSELAQSLVPSRDTSLYDLLADMLGLGIALALCAFFHRTRAFRLFH